MTIKRSLPILLILIFMVSIQLIDAQNSGIIPEPVKWEQKRGKFTFAKNIEIFYPAADNKMQKNAGHLKSFLANIPGTTISLNSYSDVVPSTGIVLALQKVTSRPERYVLEVNSRYIKITGDDHAGVFYGIQSLRQLLPPQIEIKESASELKTVSIQNLLIEDYPQFAYRGMHLDVARHFFEIDFIKKYIDLLALHKMNTFHWHLTEDQGWRIEIKKYPLLTEVGAWRKETLIGHGSRPPFQYDGIPYGGYYTQEQAREIVTYAADRFINVIPEIEMPGHATAALAAYPQLGCTGGPYEVVTRWGIFEDAFCAGNDFTFEFLENVLSEVIEIFPSRYIHIGGDECLKNRWKECARCQGRMASENLADEDELQSYFIHRIEEFLLSKGRNIIGWDEILEGGLAPQATVMSWRGVEGGIEAAHMGHDVIMSPVSHCYFDYYQADPETQPLAIGGYTPLRKVYMYNPIPDAMPEKDIKHVMGAQGNVWTEYIKTPQHVEYMVFPRAIALAEVLWTPRRKHDFQTFSSRLKHHTSRLDQLNVNYFKEWDK